MNFTAIKTKLTELPIKYGAAWLISIQVLGTITYFIILALLLVSQVDVSFIVRKLGLTSVADMSNTLAGRGAVAFVINRLLSPLRLIACFWIVPAVAPWLNPILSKYYEKLTGKKINVQKEEVKDK